MAAESSDRERRPRPWLVPAILFVVACALIFPNLGDRHLWQDEAETALIAKNVMRTGLPLAWDGRAFVTQMYESVKRSRAAGRSLQEAYAEARSALEPQFGHWVIFDHCLPFDVSRAYDEAGGVADPRIWTAQRDAEMWRSLEGA